MFNYIMAVVDYVKSSYTKLVKAFHPENYLFFDTTDTVYPEHLVNLSANVSATPKWVYSKDAAVFRLWGDERLVPVSLQYLSLEIVLDGEVLYDLTDYVEKLKVYTTGHPDAASPSLMDILTAWSLHSGVVLDNKREFIYRIITDSGDTIEVRQYEESDLTEDVELETEPVDEMVAEELSEGEPLLSAEDSTNYDKED